MKSKVGRKRGSKRRVVVPRGEGVSERNRSSRRRRRFARARTVRDATRAPRVPVQRPHRGAVGVVHPALRAERLRAGGDRRGGHQERARGVRGRARRRREPPRGPRGVSATTGRLGRERFVGGHVGEKRRRGVSREKRRGADVRASRSSACVETRARGAHDATLTRGVFSDRAKDTRFQP